MEEVEINTTSSSVLSEFKNTPIDTAVIYYNKYPQIFTDAFSEVLKDSTKVVLFENYCNKNGIDFNSRAGIFTIIASFHKKLNKEKIDIKALKKRMFFLAKKVENQK